jgi:hypothetical protein
LVSELGDGFRVDQDMPPTMKLAWKTATARIQKFFAALGASSAFSA